MQPTHARWEPLSPSVEKVPDLHGTIASIEDNNANTQDRAADSIFPTLPSVFARNFMISDTYYTAPSNSALGYPGMDENVLDVGPGGLSHITEDVLAALPEDCRQAFNKARSEEELWKESWGDESARAKLRITYNT